MNISWVVASGYQIDPTVDLSILQNIGPIWGSWQTWRSCGTDNVVCHNAAKAQELIQRNFQTSCNFYIPEQNFRTAGRPRGVKFYGGEFAQEMDNIEDIIALHLASSGSNIVLMIGFDFPKISADITDRFNLHKIKNYYGLSRSLIINQPQIQWVLIDHSDNLDKTFKDLPNLTRDSLGNVLQLLAQ